MRTSFLFSKLTDNTGQETLFNTAVKLGYEAKWSNYKPFSSDKPDDYPDNSNVVFFGSLLEAQRIRRTTNWVPGVWCNVDNLKCSSYYGYFGEWLLNQDYRILPWGEFKRLKELPWHGCFIRPDSGQKSFAGYVIQPNRLDIEKKYLDTYLKPSDLIVIARPLIIDEEYRFFIRSRDIIGFSKYMESFNIIKDFSVKYKNNFEMAQAEQACRYVNSIIKNVAQTPDHMYVIDVANIYSPNRWGIIELNSFSCSGIYGCNPVKLIEESAKQAEIEYKELYES